MSPSPRLFCHVRRIDASAYPVIQPHFMHARSPCCTPIARLPVIGRSLVRVHLRPLNRGMGKATQPRYPTACILPPYRIEIIQVTQNARNIRRLRRIVVKNTQVYLNTKQPSSDIYNVFLETHARTHHRKINPSWQYSSPPQQPDAPFRSQQMALRGFSSDVPGAGCC